MSILSIFKKKSKSTIKPKDLMEEIADPEQNLTDLFTSLDSAFLSCIGADELSEIVPDMLRDGQVYADLETLKSFVTDQSFDVWLNEEFEEDATAKRYLDVYKNVMSYNGGQLMLATDPLLECLDYGHVICEVVWDDPECNSGRWYVKKLVPLDITKFGFNKGREIVNLQTGEILDDPYKYVYCTHDETNGNPYGNSLLLKAYWPWIFKKAAIKAGVLYLKKSIIPSIVAIFKAAETEVKTKERGNFIAAELSKLQNSSAAAAANIESIETVGATSKGNDIIDLQNMFNSMISKAILGTATLTNDSKFSNRGDSEALTTVIDLRAKKIAQKELQPVINELYRWHLDLNVPEVDPSKAPYFAYASKYDPELEEVLNTVNTGVDISQNWIREKYGMVAPEDEQDTAGKNETFSANDFFLQKPRKSARQMTETILKNIQKST